MDSNDSEPSVINEKGIFSAIWDKYKSLQSELQKEKAANLKKGEYVTPKAFAWVGKWIEQAGPRSRYSYDMTVYPGDEKEFTDDLTRFGFHKEDKTLGHNAIFSAKIIAEENKLLVFNGGGQKINHPTMLGAAIVVVDKNNDVWISVKAIKNLDTGEAMDDVYYLLSA